MPIRATKAASAGGDEPAPARRNSVAGDGDRPGNEAWFTRATIDERQAPASSLPTGPRPERSRCG